MSDPNAHTLDCMLCCPHREAPRSEQSQCHCQQDTVIWDRQGTVTPILLLDIQSYRRSMYVKESGTWASQIPELLAQHPK